jgi:alpha-tubulin suppressor-like RCC1 family protein
MRSLPFLFLLAISLLFPQFVAAEVVATYNSATDIPVTANGYSATGTFSATLNFAPPTGTTLTVVKNTGLGFINGTFSNLQQGQVVTLPYAGINYRFIANYYGGTGNDLVLMWGKTRPVAWGNDENGQVGDRNTTNRLVPVNVRPNGALSGKTVLSVSTGGTHNLALCSDGTMVAWGNNIYGQLGVSTAVNGLIPVAVTADGFLSGKTVVAVSAGGDHSLALCSDGSIAAWGANYSGQLGNNNLPNASWTPVAVNMAGALQGKTVVAVSAGGNHSMALCSDGTVFAWGGNISGQLGNNSTTLSPVPVAVDTSGILAGKMVVAVSAGGIHSLALCSDGTVASWGDSRNGQLGNNTTVNSSVPVAVTTTGVLSGKTVAAIAAGGSHNMVRCSDGTVAVWGDNDGGQLGNGGTVNSLVPVAVNTGALVGKTVTAVAAGGNHCLALCSDNALVAWGYNHYGQLGNNSTSTTSTTPVNVDNGILGNEECYSILSGGGSGGGHSVAFVATSPSPIVSASKASNLTKTSASLNGTVDPNGNATTAFFEYGLDTTYGGTASVALTPNDEIGQQMVSANISSLLPGTVYHFRLTASNADGSVSTSDRTFSTASDLSPIYNSASDVPLTIDDFWAGGATFNPSLNFLPVPGTTLTVVNNTGPEFIHGRFSNLAQGQKVALSYGGTNYIFVANYYGGTGNDLVLQWADNRAIAWGSNDFGQIGDNSEVNRLTPVELASSSVLAGKTIVAEAAGEHFSLVLCSDGTLAAWGSNGFGALGNGMGVDSKVPVAVRTTTGPLAGKVVVAIAAGKAHAMALCSDGTVATWGSNVSGELGNGGSGGSGIPVAVDTSGVLAGKLVVGIAAGEFLSVALCSDGTIATWGHVFSTPLITSVPIALNTEGALAGKTVIAVKAGRSENRALCSDGTMAAWWLDNINPSLLSNSGAMVGKTVKTVALGDSHAIGLCTDSVVVASGDNSRGQLGNNSVIGNLPVAVDTSGLLAGKTVVSVAAGKYHSLARCSDGTLAAWGDNSSGQLGNNSTTQSMPPVAVNGGILGSGERFADVASGFSASHSLGLIASWPIPVASAQGVTNLTPRSATLHGVVNPNGNASTAFFEYGLDTSYGSTADTTLAPNDGLAPQNVSVNLTNLSPGTTYHYRLTIANLYKNVVTTDATFTTAVEVATIYNSPLDVPVTASSVLAAGGTFNATLNFAPNAGTNLMVVNNTGVGFINGQFNNLAQGQLVTLNYNGVGYQFVANYFGGTGNDLVLQWAKTKAVAWGSNGAGQIGDSSTTVRRVPVNVLATGVLAGKTIVATATSSGHSLALCADGTLAAWGTNGIGQLGNNSNVNSAVPVLVDTSGVLAGKRVIGVSAGSSFSVVWCSDGTVAAWGRNDVGQLGNSSTTDSSVPVAVSMTAGLFGKTVVSVAAGNSHCVALCSNGMVVGWGNNGIGQLGNNNSSPYFTVAVAVTTTGVLAGKTVVSVAAGNAHSLALCSDGTLVAWGANTVGQLGNNSTNSSSVPVVVNMTGAFAGKTVARLVGGNNSSMTVCADGSVIGWGSNASGQLGNNTVGSQSTVPVAMNVVGVLAGKAVVSVACGNNFTLAPCSDGSIVAWGQNIFGTLGNNSTTTTPTPIAVNSNLLGTGERFTTAVSAPWSNHSLALVASPPAPVVASLAVTDLAMGSAKMNGVVNAATGSATVSFDYGLTSDYGNSAASSEGPVTGSTATAVSANLTGLAPNTTYHYRVRAITTGGTTTGADMTFTTPPGGTMVLAPTGRVDAGAPLTVTFADWTDVSVPLSYAVLVDDVVVVPQGGVVAPSFNAPTSAGAHTLKGRVYNALGNYAEVMQSFTVYTAQESWRLANFGSAENLGNSADSADPDGDGCDNSFEYVAGLVPTSAASRFSLHVDLVAAHPEQKAIVFSPVVAGRTYTVKYKANLSDASWMVLSDLATSDNGAERTVTDLSAGTELRFYRVEITRP